MIKIKKQVMNKTQLTQEQQEQLDILQSRFLNANYPEEMDKILKEIIQLLPNDYDLGTYIRGLYSLES